LQGQPTNTITARYGEAQGSGSYVIESKQQKILQRGHGYNQGGEHDTAPTLTSNSWQENNHLLNGIRIRKLTPRECWRLQGFPDWAFDRAQAVNSNSQLYK
ncbi:TPA: DNA cytosine methyltransferase, partial [Streptococcus suis]